MIGSDTFRSYQFNCSELIVSSTKNLALLIILAGSNFSSLGEEIAKNILNKKTILLS